MTSVPASTASRRLPTQLAGGWEIGLLVLMAVLYLGGALVNPAFFGSTEAFHAVLRDAARYAVMAVGMTFVIVNKDLDLSVGSTYGLVGVAFSIFFAPSFYDMGVVPALLLCLVLGVVIGLINGVLVTYLRVPAFIATLTMLLIGRGLVLGLTGGKSIAYPQKARDFAEFFHLGETNFLDFNNQIPIAIAIVIVGAIALAKTRWGYETFATGGNEQAAIYSGIPTRWVRVRAYLLSSLCATVAALMAIAQDKGVTSQSGLSAELIVIAAVIIGGASILGGRGRVAGACLGAVLTVLIDKVLREGWPTTRVIKIGDAEVTVNAVSQLPVGAVPAFLGLLLLVAVLIEPYIIRRQIPARLWAWFRRRPPPPAPESGGIAIEGVQTKGTMASDRALTARGLGRFLARRDALAIILTLVLWLVGFYLRPDYWWNLGNTFAILLNFTELGILTIGLTYVIANGDIDLSVGAVLALAGAATAYGLKVLGLDPWQAICIGFLAGTFAGLLNAGITVGFGLPAFIATLGMFYIARGLAAWIVAGQQLTGFPESFNLLGPQARRRARLFPHERSARILPQPHRRGECPDDLARPRRHRLRNHSRLHAVRPAGLRHRRQPARRRLRRHQHAPRSVPGADVLRLLRHHGRHHLRRLLPELQPYRRAVPRARRHRLGHHRRRVDLRRLRHHHRLARRRRRHHARPRPPAAQHHHRERRLHRSSAALGQRLHRRHPHRRRAD